VLIAAEKFRGFCFITFRNPKVMEKVLKMTHKIEGYNLQLKKAISKNESRQRIVEEKYRKVFIVGLHHEAQENDLQNYFSKFGKI
jgi:RNA recognition motif-containing protein